MNAPKFYLSIKRSCGFTLIELIIVIIILGILSATIAPKFFSSTGLTEYTYRSDVIAKLRLLQTKRMQQTANDLGYCYQILVNAKQLGVPSGDCDDTPSFDTNWQPQATGVIVETADNITFSTNATNNVFEFDTMGRPIDCNNVCSITITGEQELHIIIEKEGYIHAS